MRIPRIYYPNPIPLEEEFQLTEEAGHHIASVLRLKANHPIVLFNGDGNEYSAQIINAQRKKGFCRGRCVFNAVKRIIAKYTFRPRCI